MGLLTDALDAYEQSLANRFDVNAGGGTYDLASEEDMAGMVFAMLVPMLMLMFVFSGCMAVAPESIAGERSAVPSPRCSSRPSSAASWPSAKS